MPVLLLLSELPSNSLGCQIIAHALPIVYICKADGVEREGPRFHGQFFKVFWGHGFIPAIFSPKVCVPFTPVGPL